MCVCVCVELIPQLITIITKKKKYQNCSRAEDFVLCWKTFILKLRKRTFLTTTTANSILNAMTMISPSWKKKQPLLSPCHGNFSALLYANKKIAAGNQRCSAKARP